MNTTTATPEKFEPTSNPENKSKEELIQYIQVLETQLRFTQRPETISKRELVKRIGEIAKLDEEDFMDVEEDYNMGLKKSGWLKLYQFLVNRSAGDINQ